MSIKWLCRNNDVMNINSFQPQMCQEKFQVSTYIYETHVHTCVSYYACSIKLKTFYPVTFSTINHVPSCDFSYFLDFFFYLELLSCFSGLCQQLCLYLQIPTYLPKCLHSSQCFVHSRQLINPCYLICWALVEFSLTQVDMLSTNPLCGNYESIFHKTHLRFSKHLCKLRSYFMFNCDKNIQHKIYHSNHI